MTRARVVLAWSCAALIGCATGARPRPSEDDQNDPRDEPPFEPVLDTDGDGIPDERDDCPQEAEDKDGFEDTDGCPDLDNDHDRIVDANDRCPNEPESYNGVADDDGCPDKGTVVIIGPHHRFDDVTFARGRAVIEARSLPLVDAVADTITKRCWVVELAGYASDDERRPEALSAARAAAVRAALSARGVSSEQLRMRSPGPASIVCRDAVETCRARTPRVELLVVSSQPCK